MFMDQPHQGTKMPSLGTWRDLPPSPPGSKWILGGDFNMICNLDEKRGGTHRIMVESGKFQGVIDNLGLIDMKTPNGLFTCTNRRSGSHQVAFRLDRFLIFDSHLMEGTTLEARILDAHRSDHWPIQLWLDIPASPGCKPFRFEWFWLNHPYFQQNTHTWWKDASIPHGSKMYRFQHKLKNFKQRLKSWNKQTFGNIFESQQQLKEQMSIL
jgi:hypothetical protein